MSPDERSVEAHAAIERVLADFPDVFGRNLDLPVTADWVLVVATESAVDPDGATTRLFTKAHQWRHRSVGLLVAATDGLRNITADAE